MGPILVKNYSSYRAHTRSLTLAQTKIFGRKGSKSGPPPNAGRFNSQESRGPRLIRLDPPPVTKPPPVQTDAPNHRAPGQKVTKEELRDLRELMRKKYALDGEIWLLKDVKPRDYPIVEVKMRMADATLQRIREIVDSFDSPEFFEWQADYWKLREIKSRMAEPGKKECWMNEPPWKEAHGTNEFAVGRS
jgi:hypothetical protein